MTLSLYIGDKTLHAASGNGYKIEHFAEYDFLPGQHCGHLKFIQQHALLSEKQIKLSLLGPALLVTILLHLILEATLSQSSTLSSELMELLSSARLSDVCFGCVVEDQEFPAHKS